MFSNSNTPPYRMSKKEEKKSMEAGQDFGNLIAW
jgi:hypothetical protein